ncbi:MAG: hypothetical protein ACF8R7_10545 [Phycisphaerales bacterium JB039]
MHEKRMFIVGLVTACGLAAAPVALAQVAPGVFVPDAIDDYESYPGARTLIPAVFGGAVPAITGTVEHRSVNQGDWFDFRTGPLVQAQSGSKFGVQYGFGYFTLDFTGIGGITGFSGWACAAGVGDDVIEFFDMFGAPMTGTFTKVGGFGAFGVMEEFSFISPVRIGSIRLTGRETCFDDIGYTTGGGGTTIRSLGTDAPPAKLCATDMVPYPLDNRPLSEEVLTVQHPVCGGGDLVFSTPMNHRRIGAGWATWSHGYTGDVYYSNGAAAITIDMPEKTSRFYTYVEPNPFSDIEFEITQESARGFDSTLAVISGSSGAQGFGFCDDGGLFTIGVRTTDTVTDFAVGEFGIYSDVEDPCPRCLADCDGSGVLDFFDFLCFQNLFGTGDCCADCDGNGMLDFFDFLCFQNEFAAGCPELELFQLGTEAPPAVLCGETMELVVDPRPVFGDVTTVPTSIGDIVFDRPCSHRVIGGGWATWSHGYTGDVYYTNGAAILNVGPPAGNTAFYLYVEPNPFSPIEFEITGTLGGESLSVIETINGSAGAAGYAFCGGVENVEVRTTDGVTDFAVGEFGVAN